MSSIQLYSGENKNLEIYPLDITRWKDFETLLGEKGGCGGCWCMSWRLKKSDFESNKGIENKNAMKSLVDKNLVIGVLAYFDGIPIGWCAVAPRNVYVRLEKSRVLKRIDNEPVWSITCLYIEKTYRRRGVSTELVKGAINYCKINGAKIIEAYPVVPYSNKVPDPFIWTGTPSAFEKAGFIVAEKRSKWKPMMRYYI